jgi:hypothetical protein
VSLSQIDGLVIGLRVPGKGTTEDPPAGIDGIFEVIIKSCITFNENNSQ